MSEEASGAQFARSCSNDTYNKNYDTSSVQILLDTENKKKSKHRKFAIGLGVAVICFGVVLCIILLSSKPDNALNLVQSNDTDARSNSSSTQKASINTTNHDKGMKNKKAHRVTK